MKKRELSHTVLLSGFSNKKLLLMLNWTFVHNVKVIDPAGIIVVETALGRDYLMSMADVGTLKINSHTGRQKIKAHFAAGSVQNDKLVWSVNVPEHS